jgi:hypothetical protein
MSGDPGHDSFEVMQRLGFGRGWPAQDDDFDSKRTRGLDLGVGRAPAAVLGHQRLHPLVAQERRFISEREGSAREDEFVIGQGVDLRWRVDRPYDVAMLRGSRECRELQTALRQKNCFWLLPKSVDGLLDRRDLRPAIGGLAYPRWASEHDERGVSGPAGQKCVGGHARREGMGRVDDGADALSDEKRREALGAAETADALGNWRLSGIRRRSRQRQDRRNVRFVGDPSRKRARFRRAAENVQAKALQWAAP